MVELGLESSALVLLACPGAETQSKLFLKLSNVADAGFCGSCRLTVEDWLYALLCLFLQLCIK